MGGSWETSCLRYAYMPLMFSDDVTRRLAGLGALDQSWDTHDQLMPRKLGISPDYQFLKPPPGSSRLSGAYTATAPGLATLELHAHGRGIRLRLRSQSRLGASGRGS
jgi:hypothetical protein